MSTMGDGNKSDGEGTSPWSREVPVPDQAIEFTRPVPNDQGEASQGSIDDAETGTQLAGSQLTAPVQRTARTRVLAAAAAVVGLAFGGWLVFGRDGSDGSDSAEPAPSTSADSGVSLPSTDDETASATDRDGSVDTATADTGSVGAGQSESANNAGSGAAWLQNRTSVPTGLGQSGEPYDIVAVTVTGTFAQLQIPSGRVDATQLSSLFAGGSVSVGPTTALVVANGMTLVRVGEAPLEVMAPTGGLDILASRLDADGYLGVEWSDNGEQIIEVAGDGSVTRIETDGSIWSSAFVGDGSVLISDAGGLYRLRDDVYERISPGFLIAASAHHVLVRECDEERACGMVVLDLNTLERRPAQAPDDLAFDSNRYYGAASISPDGNWLRVFDYGERTTERVVDLTTGDTTVQAFVNDPIRGAGGDQWAPDSSGYFRAGVPTGIEFVDVATGEVTLFGEEVAGVSSIAVRATSTASVDAPAPTTQTGIRLVGVTESGDVVEIDVDSEVVEVTSGPAFGSRSSVTVLTDTEGATIVSAGDERARRFDAASGSVAELAANGPVGQLIAGPTSDTVWEQVESDTDGQTEFRLVDALGSPVGPEIGPVAEADSVIGTDGAGGVLVASDLGGVYVHRPDGAERITTGEVVAINATIAYVRECDAASNCGVAVVDRASGQRAPVSSQFEAFGIGARRGRQSGTTVSPDGQLLAVADAAGGNPLIVDLDAGSVTPVPRLDTGSSMIWAADSSAAVWRSEGALVIYDRSARSVRRLPVTELVAVAQAAG